MRRIGSNRWTTWIVVPLSQKYKAKPVIDVFLYRGGDLAGSGISKLLEWLGMGLVGLAAGTLPFLAMPTAPLPTKNPNCGLEGWEVELSK